MILVEIIVKMQTTGWILQLGTENWMKLLLDYREAGDDSVYG